MPKQAKEHSYAPTQAEIVKSIDEILEENESASPKEVYALVMKKHITWKIREARVVKLVKKVRDTDHTDGADEDDGTIVRKLRRKLSKRLSVGKRLMKRESSKKLRGGGGGGGDSHQQHVTIRDSSSRNNLLTTPAKKEAPPDAGVAGKKSPTDESVATIGSTQAGASTGTQYSVLSSSEEVVVDGNKVESAMIEEIVAAKEEIVTKTEDIIEIVDDNNNKEGKEHQPPVQEISQTLINVDDYIPETSSADVGATPEDAIDDDALKSPDISERSADDNKMNSTETETSEISVSQVSMSQEEDATETSFLDTGAGLDAVPVKIVETKASRVDGAAQVMPPAVDHSAVVEQSSFKSEKIEAPVDKEETALPVVDVPPPKIETPLIEIEEAPEEDVFETPRELETKMEIPHIENREFVYNDDNDGKKEPGSCKPCEGGCVIL